MKHGWEPDLTPTIYGQGHSEQVQTAWRCLSLHVHSRNHPCPHLSSGRCHHSDCGLMPGRPSSMCAVTERKDNMRCCVLSLGKKKKKKENHGWCPNVPVQTWVCVWVTDCLCCWGSSCCRGRGWSATSLLEVEDWLGVQAQRSSLSPGFSSSWTEGWGQKVGVQGQAPSPGLCRPGAWPGEHTRRPSHTEWHHDKQVFI